MVVIQACEKCLIDHNRSQLTIYLNGSLLVTISLLCQRLVDLTHKICLCMTREIGDILILNQVEKQYANFGDITSVVH